MLFALLFAILEILPTYSPYNAVVGVVLSQKWNKYVPITSGMSSGASATPLTASERVNTFSTFHLRYQLFVSFRSRAWRHLRAVSNSVHRPARDPDRWCNKPGLHRKSNCWRKQFYGEADSFGFSMLLHCVIDIECVDAPHHL